MGWLSGLVWCSAGLGTLSVTLGVLLYVFQDKLLYIPSIPVKNPDDNPHGFRNPREQGISYEDIYATTLDGVTIHGWLLKSPNSDEIPTLVYLHGNAGNIGFRLTNARQMQLAIGCNVLMVDYRGYGKSEGKPTQEGLLLDVEASLRALRENSKFGVDPKKIFLFGRSLGGAVALGAAERYPDQVLAVIVENTFLSVSHMVDELFPWLSRVKWLVLWLKWNSEESIRRLTRPVLFISGLRDELIPPWHMRALYNAYPALSGVGKRLITVADGGHNDTWEKGGQKCLRAMEVFVQEVMAEAETPGDSTAPKEPNTAVGDGKVGGNGAREAPSGKGSINGEASAGAENGDGPAVVTHVPLLHSS